EEKIMANLGYVSENHNNSHHAILRTTLTAGRDCKTLTEWRKCIFQLRDEILSQILRHDLHFAEYLTSINYNDSA
ncbi:MAG: hypothetical protein L3J50_13255, partial [Emcibacter sp.]|nr:hypothetical protein [Emcibacter sp.]